MNKTNRATFRLLRAKIQKALAQHWFIERTYVKRYLARKKHKSKPVLAGLGHVLYDPSTKETGFLKRNSGRSYRALRLESAFPRAVVSGLVILKNYSKIGTGIVGQVVACDRCVSGLRAVYMIPELFRPAKLASVLKRSRLCACIDKHIISTCTPKPIKKTDFSLVTQAYADPQIANWLLSDEGFENFTQRLLGNPPTPVNWAGIPAGDLSSILHDEFPFHHRLVATCRLIFFFLGETHVTSLLNDLFPGFEWEKKFEQTVRARRIIATTTTNGTLIPRGTTDDWIMTPEIPDPPLLDDDF